MPFLPSLRPSASLLDVFKAYPETSQALIEFHEVLLRGSSPFTEAERELIAAYVSGMNQALSSASEASLLLTLEGKTRQDPFVTS